MGLIRLFVSIIRTLNKKQRLQMVGIGFLIVLCSLFETASIALLMPLIELLTNGKVESEIILSLFGLLHRDVSEIDKMLILSILVILVYVLKNIIIVAQGFSQYRFSYDNERIISSELLEKTLNRPYIYHVYHNSAELQRNITRDVQNFFGSTLSYIQLISELCTCSFLFVYLLIQDINVTLCFSGVMIAFLYFVFLKFKRKLAKWGNEIREADAELVKWINQALFGIKNIKVSNKEQFFSQSYNKIYSDRSSRQVKWLTLSNSIRPLMETICIIAVLAYVLGCSMLGRDITNIAPLLTVFVAAAIRLLPSLSRIGAYVNSITIYESTIYAVCEGLAFDSDLTDHYDIDTVSDGDITFNSSISFEDVSFFYPSNPDKYIIKNVNLSIRKNSSVAFVGASGAGKTTFMDILLGLLIPVSGIVKADNCSIFDNINEWHKKIGYISQDIFLLDDTIRNNVAFGIQDSKINDEKVWEVLRMAQMENYVRSMEKGINTVIGDNGSKLSGGQRQRIGIARALYREPEILVLDEATSALDEETEKAIMDAVYGLSDRITIIIITHRMSTITQCNHVYEICDGKLLERK